MVGSLVLGSVNILGGLVFGYNSGIVAVALETSRFAGYNSVYLGLFTAAILVGATFGSLFGGLYSDKFGRKIALLTVAVIAAVGALATALSPNFVALCAARCFLGIGVGLSTVACPTYVSENAVDSWKGTLGTLFQLAITFGIFLSYLAAIPLRGVNYDWRWMFGIGIFPGLFLFLLCLFIPESNYWIATKVNEYDPLLANKRGSIQEKPKVKDLFHYPTSRYFIIGQLLAVAQQLTGINAIMFYAPSIFKAANVQEPIIATIAVGAWNFATTFIATFLVDRLGRRPLLLGGTLAMAVSTLALGLTYLIHDVPHKSVLSILFLFIFIAGFETGEGPLFWVVCTELFEPKMRGTALSSLNASVWVYNLILTFGFPVLSTAIGQGPVFMIFGGIGAVCVIAMFFFLPETKNINVNVVVYE